MTLFGQQHGLHPTWQDWLRALPSRIAAWFARPSVTVVPGPVPPALEELGLVLVEIRGHGWAKLSGLHLLERNGTWTSSTWLWNGALRIALLDAREPAVLTVWNGRGRTHAELTCAWAFSRPVSVPGPQPAVPALQLTATGRASLLAQVRKFSLAARAMSVARAPQTPHFGIPVPLQLQSVNVVHFGFRVDSARLKAAPQAPIAQEV